MIHYEDINPVILLLSWNVMYLGLKIRYSLSLIMVHMNQIVIH